MVKATGCFVRAGRSRLGCQCFCGGRGWAVQVEDTAFSKALWPSGRTLHLPSLEEAGMAWQAEKAGGGGGGRPPRAAGLQEVWDCVLSTAGGDGWGGACQGEIGWL